MSENAWVGERPEHAAAGPASTSRPSALTLEAFIDRELRAMEAEGRTMAKWLAGIDELRAKGLLPELDLDEVVADIHQARAERERRIAEW